MKHTHTHQKTLICAGCRRLTPHQFARVEQRSHSFECQGGGGTVKGDGFKDIWTCQQCGKERIYGAPSDGEVTGVKSRRGRPRKAVAA